MVFVRSHSHLAEVPRTSLIGNEDIFELEAGEHTREQPRLNLPTPGYENSWETVETIDLWLLIKNQ
jgi:hypothetical protein